MADKFSRKDFFRKCGKGALMTSIGGMLVPFSQAQQPTPPREAEPALPYRIEPVDVIRPELDEPLGLAIDGDNNLHVAGRGGIQVFSADGQPTRRMELEGAYCAVAMGDQGQLFAAQRARVEVYDREGNRVAVWGQLGDAPGDFRYITGLVPAGHFVYVVDPGARRVHRFAINGDYVDAIEGFQIPSGYMDAALDAGGRLHVTHTGRHRIECYDPNGSKVSEWGYFGPRRECFCGCCNPTNLALFPDGRVATTEKGVPRLKVYNAQAGLMACLDETHFPGNAAGMDLAVDSKGGIALLVPASGEVRRYRLVENGAA